MLALSRKKFSYQSMMRRVAVLRKMRVHVLLHQTPSLFPPIMAEWPFRILLLFPWNVLPS